MSHQCHLRVFHWSSSDSKSPQLTRNVLSILADLSSAIVWIVSARPLNLNPSNPVAKHLGIVPSAPVMTGITVTLIFHNVFSSLPRLKYLSLFWFFFFFFNFNSMIVRLGKFHYLMSSLSFSLFDLSLGLVFWPGLGNPFVSKDLRDYFAFHFSGRILGCAFVSLDKFHFLAQFPVDHNPYPVVSRLGLFLC